MSDSAAPFLPTARALDPYLEALERKELLTTRCRSCGHTQFPPRSTCSSCSSVEPAEWIPASGRGTIWSFGIFHKAYFPDFVPPYNVAVVELDEGTKLFTNIVGALNSPLAVGMRVRAVFDATGDGVALRFELDPSRHD